eukprot:Hpha_TRINITY_DN16134_c0_g1::TRINITY_DN16134_c0_g1_i1::g.7044::m.7044
MRASLRECFRSSSRAFCALVSSSICFWRSSSFCARARPFDFGDVTGADVPSGEASAGTCNGEISIPSPAATSSMPTIFSSACFSLSRSKPMVPCCLLSSSLRCRANILRSSALSSASPTASAISSSCRRSSASVNGANSPEIEFATGTDFWNNSLMAEYFAIQENRSTRERKAVTRHSCSAKTFLKRPVWQTNGFSKYRSIPASRQSPTQSCVALFGVSSPMMAVRLLDRPPLLSAARTLAVNSSPPITGISMSTNTQSKKPCSSSRSASEPFLTHVISTPRRSKMILALCPWIKLSSTSRKRGWAFGERTISAWSALKRYNTGAGSLRSLPLALLHCLSHHLEAL